MSFIGFIRKAIVERHGPRPDAWKSHPIRECGEPLVPLGPFVEPDAPGFSTRIFQDSIYWGETRSSPYLDPNRKLDGALLTALPREGVARKLADAAVHLQKKYGKQYGLLVCDAYRPLSVQKALYDDLRKQLVDLGLDAEAAERQAQRYASKPSADRDTARAAQHRRVGGPSRSLV